MHRHRIRFPAILLLAFSILATTCSSPSNRSGSEGPSVMQHATALQRSPHNNIAVTCKAIFTPLSGDGCNEADDVTPHALDIGTLPQPLAIAYQYGVDGHAYTDVEDANVHKPSIDTLAAMGLFDGTECAAGRFCPSGSLQRWVMAVWLIRSIESSEPPPIAISQFADVDPTEWWAPYVERLAEQGITVGCSVDPLRYCPDGHVTRAQMASFIARALRLRGLPADFFVDTKGNVHEENIVALAVSGITAGCKTDPISYCPNRQLTRAEMATFLARALELNIQIRTVALAPTSEENFKVRFVPYGLAAEQYHLSFNGDGRFKETSAGSTVGGRYQYHNIGRSSATLTQTYDDGNFGGSCETHIEFDTSWTGTLEYSCADGSTSRQNWLASKQQVPAPPTITPVVDTDTAVWVSFFDTFGPQETRSYDFQVRATNNEAPSIDGCSTIANTRNQPVSDEFRTRITGLQPGMEYEFRYRYRNSSQCGEPVDIEWSHPARATTGGSAILQSPTFVEGSSTTRSIPEGTPPGVRVGTPVSARGIPTLTYSIEGSDADSFVVVPGTGQIRTSDGIIYDHETKDQYRVVVRAMDPSGKSNTIDVTIHITDLEPSCARVQHLRVNEGDKRLTVRWSHPIARDGHAPIQGYHTEIRQSSTSSWSARRVLLGTEPAGLTYVELLNDQSYEIRIRPINAEGHCGWSDPVTGVPSGGTAPADELDLADRIKDRWVGTPDRNWRILTQGRCRHTTSGAVFDAYCSYQRTAPDAGRISLAFDDPSRGSCDVVFAFSSLTSGSFVDDCWEAGVNAENLPTEFIMPPYPARTATELEQLLSPENSRDTSSLAPRTQAEFDRLAGGRRDFIPGVIIGEADVGYRSFSVPGIASILEYDRHGRRSFTRFASYKYENTGPSEGLLTVTPGNGGEARIFRLEFDGGTMGITVENSEGEAVNWWAETYPEFAEVPQLTDPLPILLPIPPTAPVAIDGPDLAPQDGADFRSRFPHDPYSGGWNDIDALLGDKALYRPFVHFSTYRYTKTGRNRATITLTFGDFNPAHPDRSPERSDAYYEQLTGAAWIIDVEFLTDDSIAFTASLSIEGSSTGLTISRVVDYDGNSTEPYEFPSETLPPDDPPQARGQDSPGVDLAAAVTAEGIGPNDLQTFVLRGADLQQAAYQPGDWLEPKDGSAQRMMIVGMNQISAIELPPSSDLDRITLIGGTSHAEVTGTTIPASLRGTLENQIPTVEPLGLYTGDVLQVHSVAQATITQLQVVCMQLQGEIPIRGARYFSQPKPAEGPTQTCQRDCVLNHEDYIQQCVWRCDDEGSTDR